MVTQQLESVDLHGARTFHTATRHLGESNADAAYHFCTAEMRMVSDPYLKECLDLMTPSLRLEGEVPDAELGALRLQ